MISYGHVHVCSKIGGLAHPVPGHGKKPVATLLGLISHQGKNCLQAYSWLVRYCIASNNALDVYFIQTTYSGLGEKLL